MISQSNMNTAEHVFEFHFIKSFFTWVMGSGTGTCNDLSDAF
jgi:hypothetical protein